VLVTLLVSDINVLSVLEISDCNCTLETSAGQIPQQRDEIHRIRNAALQRLCSQLGIQPLSTDDQVDNTASSGEVALLRMLSVTKGRRMMARAIAVLPPIPLQPVLETMARNMCVIFIVNMTESTTCQLANAVSNAVQQLAPAVSTMMLASVLQSHSDSQLRSLLQDQYAATVLTAVLLKGSEMRLNPLEAAQWKTKFTQFHERLSADLLQLAQNSTTSAPDTVEWIFMLLAGYCSSMSYEQRLQLLKQLRPLLKQRFAESPSPALRTFIHRMRDGVPSGELLIELGQLV